METMISNADAYMRLFKLLTLVEQKMVYEMISENFELDHVRLIDGTYHLLLPLFDETGLYGKTYVKGDWQKVAKAGRTFATSNLISHYHFLLHQSLANL